MNKKTKLRFGVKERYVRKPTRRGSLSYIFEQIETPIEKSFSEQVATHQQLLKSEKKIKNYLNGEQDENIRI